MNARGPLEAATEVRHEGFGVQPRALTARQVAQCRAACETAHAATRGRAASLPGRYDLSVPALAGPNFPFLHAGAPWMNTVRALLGDDCVLLAGGVVGSDPGAAVGEAHRGGGHLLGDPLAGAAAAAPHCIAVLIPLVGGGGGETSGVAMWPRSHHGAGWSPPPPAAGPPSSPGDEASAAAAASAASRDDDDDVTAAVSSALRAGDALLFDPRLLHKALGNNTGARVPLVYLVLARPWFRLGTQRLLGSQAVGGFQGRDVKHRPEVEVEEEEEEAACTA